MNQKMKIAAIEAMWHTEDAPAGFTIFAIPNQETQIKDWKFQYNTLQLENQKLKIKSKFVKIGAGLVIGGLTYMMLTK